MDSWGEKASMITHTNPRGGLKWPSAVTRLTAMFTSVLMSHLAVFKYRIESARDAQWPFWDLVSVNNTKLKLKFV